uniref:Secreted protein n=1 Tax=Sipha flava TaxID=143950 RepID=A0A2S2QPT9_9HEMI
MRIIYTYRIHFTHLLLLLLLLFYFLSNLSRSHTHTHTHTHTQTRACVTASRTRLDRHRRRSVRTLRQRIAAVERAKKKNIYKIIREENVSSLKLRSPPPPQSRCIQ